MCICSLASPRRPGFLIWSTTSRHQVPSDAGTDTKSTLQSFTGRLCSGREPTLLPQSVGLRWRSSASMWKPKDRSLAGRRDSYPVSWLSPRKGNARSQNLFAMDKNDTQTICRWRFFRPSGNYSRNRPPVEPRPGLNPNRRSETSVQFLAGQPSSQRLILRAALRYRSQRP